MPIRTTIGTATTALERATIDTSFWIEGLRGTLSETALALIPAREHCVVPTIVQYELAKWLAREADTVLAEGILAYTQRCFVVGLHTSIAFRAATISARDKLAMADAIILATAFHEQSVLLTCDAHFEGLNGVMYFPKRQG